MDADLQKLTELADKLRSVDTLGVKIAEAAIPDVVREAKRTADAGTTADGDAWRPKIDGTRALPRAAGAISAIVSGTSKAVITLVLSGVYVFHHRGKGRRKRPILFEPKDGVPAPMATAIASAAKRVIGRAMGAS